MPVPVRELPADWAEDDRRDVEGDEQESGRERAEVPHELEVQAHQEQHGAERNCVQELGDDASHEFPNPEEFEIEEGVRRATFHEDEE